MRVDLTAMVVAALVLLAGCGPRFSPPAVDPAQLDAARQAIIETAPATGMAGAPEVMLAGVSQRLAQAAQPLCTAYRSQRLQLDDPADPKQPSNLWAPVRGDHGAHGRFDRDARKGNLQVWAAMHRGAVSAGVAALVAMSWLGFRWTRG